MRNLASKAVPAVLVAAVLVAACSNDPAESAGPTQPPSVSEQPTVPPSEPTPTKSTPTREPAAAVTLDIVIADGDISPEPGRVNVGLGETVLITVASDQPDKLHLHGYDIEAAVAPNESGRLEFTADQPGVFELETHDSGLVLTQLVVE